MLNGAARCVIEFLVIFCWFGAFVMLAILFASSLVVSHVSVAVLDYFGYSLYPF